MQNERLPQIFKNIFYNVYIALKFASAKTRIRSVLCAKSAMILAVFWILSFIIPKDCKETGLGHEKLYYLEKIACNAKNRLYSRQQLCRTFHLLCNYTPLFCVYVSHANPCVQKNRRLIL